MASTWWGKAWNQNLEKYADYENRIGRGRSYVRHGSVLDLQIESKQIKAQVAGSGSSIYTVDIRIKEIKKATWMKIRKKCEGQLNSLQKLLAGKFPKDLQEIFTVKGQGLFPSPKEITFECSCPDWAVMCKHVAATLYGIGARLDEDPELFFKLRNAKVKDLISQAISSKTSELLGQAKKKSQKALEETDLSDLFGIDLEEKQKAVPKKKAKVAINAKALPTQEKANQKKPIIHLAKSSLTKKSQLRKNSQSKSYSKRAFAPPLI